VRVQFRLIMDDLVVNGQKIDQVVMDWETDVDQQEILEVSHQWVTTKNFLTRRMVGLNQVGESSLTIHPL
jgi:hypothetical protein